MPQHPPIPPAAQDDPGQQPLPSARQHAGRVRSLALIAASLIPLAILGVRLGLWPFRVSFLLLLASWVLGVVVLIMLGFIFLRRSPARPFCASCYLALPLALAPLLFLAEPLYLATTHPQIHDISTDLQDPPKFVEAAAQRGPADHPVHYEGTEVADLQRAAYPDLQSLQLSAPPLVVFAKAEDLLRGMDLEVIASDPAAGRIEAVATSKLFGFKDDVVVRIRATEQGSVVDVRSMSRVGKSDLGMNAKRVRQILAGLR